MTFDLEAVYQSHLARVRTHMASRQIDFLFLPPGPEFYYLTGSLSEPFDDQLRIWGDWIDGIFLGLEDNPVIIHHSAYGGEIPVTPHIEISEFFIMPDDHPDPDATLQKALGTFRTEGKTVATVKRTWSQTLLGLQRAAPRARFVALDEPGWDAITAVKDDYELSIMREAAAMTVEVMDEVARFIKVGMKVVDLKSEIITQMFRRGVTQSFPMGINCANKDSDPNIRWEPQTAIQPLSVLAFDFGLTYKGYQTDFGRSLFVKDALPDRLRAWSVLTRINRELAERMGSGKITPLEMYAHGERLAKENNFFEGYYGYSRWCLGHAIGTNVHEWPWVREGHPSAHQPIQAGMVFCLEPKIFHWGQFFERVEDMILVGPERGELLTPYTYEPVIVG